MGLKVNSRGNYELKLKRLFPQGEDSTLIADVRDYIAEKAMKFNRGLEFYVKSNPKERMVIPSDQIEAMKVTERSPFNSKINEDQKYSIWGYKWNPNLNL